MMNIVLVHRLKCDMLGCDASQGTGRVFQPISGANICPTLTPDICFFLHEPWVWPLLGIEQMMLQGWHLDMLIWLASEGVTDTLFRELSGNSFAAASIAALLIAMLVALPFSLADALGAAAEEGRK